MGITKSLPDRNGFSFWAEVQSDDHCIIGNVISEGVDDYVVYYTKNKINKVKLDYHNGDWKTTKS